MPNIWPTRSAHDNDIFHFCADYASGQSGVVGEQAIVQCKLMDLSEN